MGAAVRRWWAAPAALLMALAAPPAFAQAAAPAGGAATGTTFPKYTGLVVDAANVLPEATRADLTAKLQKLQDDTHRQLVVATIPDLGGRDVADYGYRLGREWGVGLRDVNNGAILFIAPNEAKGHRGPRIEVGYGLEPVLTDALSSTIIRQDMMPRLVAGDVPGAMEAGTDAIVQQLRAAPEEAKARTDAAVAAFNKEHQRTRSSGGGGGGLMLAFWLFVIGFFVLSRFRRGGGGRAYTGGSGSGGGSGLGSAVLWGAMLGAMNDRGRGGGWSGGGSSGDGGGSDGGSSGGWGDGGFSGGGGGSFGGGGASGDW